MKISYSFSSPQGDVPVDDATLARPFIVRPFQDHPFISLEDYFLTIKNLILRDDARSLMALLNRLWKRPVERTELDTLTIRYEKYGTLYHIASTEITAGTDRTRIAVTTALTETSKETLEREFGLLERLNLRTGHSYLPQVYCKHAVEVRKAEGSENLLMTLSQWFDEYHEWHFHTDEAGKQGITLWDMKSGYRLMTDEEAREIIRRATTILTYYYDMQGFHRIFPWHHGGGDFVVKSEHGAVDVKLITVRGYEPFSLPEQVIGDRFAAILLFFLETTLKMRLDKYEGLGESTWVGDESLVKAAVDGFFQALTARESEGEKPAITLDDIVQHLNSLTENELKRLLHTHLDGLVQRDTSDYSAVSAHLDEHARDLYQALQDR